MPPPATDPTTHHPRWSWSSGSSSQSLAGECDALLPSELQREVLLGGLGKGAVSLGCPCGAALSCPWSYVLTDVHPGAAPASGCSQRPRGGGCKSYSVILPTSGRCGERQAASPHLSLRRDGTGAQRDVSRCICPGGRASLQTRAVSSGRSRCSFCGAAVTPRHHAQLPVGQGCQTHCYRGPHQPRSCLQRAEIILGLYKYNYSLTVKELKLHSAL